MAQCVFQKNLGGKSTDLSFITATATDIVSGKTGVDTSGASVSGVIQSLAGATYNTSTNQQTMSVSSGEYSTGLQLFRGEKLSNPVASQVLSGATFTIGDTANSTRLLNLAGSMSNLSGSNIDVPINITSSSGYLTMGIPSNGYYTTDGRLQYAASGLGAAQTSSVASGVTFSSRHGIGQTGTLTTLGATTYALSTASRSIATGRILTGAQTIQAITGTASAAVARTGKTFSSAKGIGLTGSLSNFSNSAISPGTAASTLSSSGKIGSANVTLNAISYTNFTAANIKKNVVITIGGKAVTGTFSGYVPDANDIYKYGSWGSGLSTAYFKAPSILNDWSNASARTAYYPTVTFNSSNISCSNFIRTGSGNWRYGCYSINKTYPLSSYSSIKVLHTESGTTGSVKNNGSTSIHRTVICLSIAPTYTHMYSVTAPTTASFYFRYTSNTTGSYTSTSVTSSQYVCAQNALTYGTAATDTFNISNITSTSYLYFQGAQDSWRVSGYSHIISRIYFA